MDISVRWFGTRQELTDLLSAFGHHCVCEVEGENVFERTCGAHALLADQRALNGLLFARRIAARLRAEEELTVVSDETPAPPRRRARTVARAGRES